MPCICNPFKFHTRARGTFLANLKKNMLPGNALSKETRSIFFRASAFKVVVALI